MLFLELLVGFAFLTDHVIVRTTFHLGTHSSNRLIAKAKAQALTNSTAKVCERVVAAISHSNDAAVGIVANRTSVGLGLRRDATIGTLADVFHLGLIGLQTASRRCNCPIKDALTLGVSHVERALNVQQNLAFAFRWVTTKDGFQLV